MKRRLLLSGILLLCLLLPATAAHTDNAAADSTTHILLINSYSSQTAWSSNLADSIETAIREQHPGWSIYNGQLKTDIAQVAASAQFTMRSVLWGYTEQRTSTVVPPTSQHFSHFFMQDDIPDALILLGDESLLIYRSLAYYLNKWEQTPVILCMTSDSISIEGWHPPHPFSYDDMVPVSHFRQITSSPTDSVPKQIHFNMSGTIASSTVRQNLTLIRQLMPGLKELVWIDNDYYSAQKKRLEVERLMPRIMPDVHYKTMIHDRRNTDSIYHAMLEPVPGRAFLTYSWNMDGLYSRYTHREIDSLFTHISTAPIFSLTQRDFEADNYYVGGYYFDTPDIVMRTVDLVDRAVAGNNLNVMPFNTITAGSIILNYSALKRYDLLSEALRLHNVTYRHIPPPFYHRYETEILVTVLFLALMLAFLFIALHRMRYNRRMRTDYIRYKRLYSRLQVIYDTGSIDFTLYDRQGNRLNRVFAETTADNNRQQSAFRFSANMFDSPYLLE
ncbi:MAG: hypothetical protein LBL97_05775, partial [Prevotellaceae bacterium]|nr:hypothetical protein [Prevotellaceae bacterium]